MGEEYWKVFWRSFFSDDDLSQYFEPDLICSCVVTVCSLRNFYVSLGDSTNHEAKEPSFMVY